jgi:hypothetical protein
MKNLILLAIACAAFIIFPLGSSAHTGSATSTPETATLETYGQWNGLEASQIIESPYTLASLKKSIKRLDSEAAGSVKIPVLFGVYRMHLKPNFGEWRSGGRTHEGLDIVVPKGAPIVSPTKAVVLSAGTGSSSGKTVSTANPGGETFVYMHLDSIADIKSGDILEPGDLIGFAGNTGNAAGGAAHLHFEIRNNGATDPYPRLLTDFNFKEKISFASEILDESKNEKILAAFLIDNYCAELFAAQNEGNSLPDSLSDGLSSDAENILSLGARNASVSALQSFLIKQNAGTAAKNLACTGPTGYFGKLTQAALIEYQAWAGITPASGTCQIPNDNDFIAVLAANDSSAKASIASSAKLSVEDLKMEILRLQTLILKLQIQLIQSKLSAAR